MENRFEMDPLNVFQSENPLMDEFSNWELGNVEITYPDQMLINGKTFEDQRIENDNYQDDCDFSDEIFRYISEMLMEEDMEEQTYMLQESLELQAKERSFYELLCQNKHPQQGGSDHPNNQENHNPMNSSNGDGNGYLADVVGSSCRDASTDYDSVSNSCIIRMDQFFDPLLACHFRNGVDDASKFLPCGSDMLVQNPKEASSKGKKNQHTDENDCKEEEPSKKLAAIYPESNVPIEEFDDVLLYTVGEREKIFESYIKDLKKIRRKSRRKNGPIEIKRRKEEFIDFRYLLMGCAKSIAACDNLAANNLINQIRENSSPFGDADQRLAHYFANGLEARMAGTDSEIYKSLVCRRTFASDYLKAYYTYLASSPFVNLANFVANNCIRIKSKKAMRVHIIDFGVLYGFQWPSFIQSLAEREGGPPKLRITGIDFPQPGFRPAERIEESGRRLARYAQKFNVPFEFNAIAKKWETVSIEDLKMEKDEFVAVNCLYRAENLRDEEGVKECSRTMVLKLIRKISPDIFIHEVVNGSYGLPFFVTRFREALYHYYTLFDMLDANVPRENPERMVLERDLFGQEALNVIACEGWERVERPETYKQWQLRRVPGLFATCLRFCYFAAMYLLLLFTLLIFFNT